MTFNSSDMIQQLRVDFEQLLTLVTGPASQRATVDQMERSVFRQVLRLGFKLLQLFLCTRTQAESHVLAAALRRQGLRYHSQKPLEYFSIFGKLTFARAYFYAPADGGVSPLDRALSLPARCYSDLLVESAELLAVDGAYQKSVQVIRRLLGLPLSEFALETAALEQSQAVQTFYRQTTPFPLASEGPILVAQADGKGVPMVREQASPPKARLGKGDKKTHKKEAIAIAVYTIEPYVRTPQQVVDALFPPHLSPPQRPRPCHKQVFASLDGKEAALKRLAQWVKRREGAHIQARVALTDGALALQQQIQRRLKDFTLVLDIIHVDEYLWQAGTALYGETDEQRAPWVAAQLLDILSSRTAEVIQRLENSAHPMAESSLARRAVQHVSNYLRRNQAYMHYADYLRDGWPIGTGVIEGVCRHLVKDRMELSGMLWTVDGAEAILALRAVHENGDWEAFHEFRRAQSHKQLYGTTLRINPIDQAERLEIN